MTEQTAENRTLQGRVVSDKMDKTVTVSSERLVKHRMYKKYIRRRSNFTAHDEANGCRIGDKVLITESALKLSALIVKSSSAASCHSMSRVTCPLLVQSEQDSGTSEVAFQPSSSVSFRKSASPSLATPIPESLKTTISVSG
mgnify:CR=1 FL=1